jgi:pimeloyl-ACP methyl ester carboxylesterase
MPRPSRRLLAYRDLGDPQGRPVLYLHGNPGSKAEVDRPAYHAEFIASGLRVIAVDRPGFGDSPGPSGPGHGPLVADVVALLNYLEIHRLVVVGMSRGTLPALALATLAPERVAGAGLYGATGLPDDPQLLSDLPRQSQLLLTLVKRAPAVARLLMRANAQLDARFPASAVARLARIVSSRPDREQLADVGQEWVDAFAEGMNPSPAVAIDDWRSWLVDPLGFDPRAVRVPILIWTGTEDTVCPLTSARRLADRVPTSQVTALDGAGHLHTPLTLTALIKSTLAAANA